MCKCPLPLQPQAAEMAAFEPVAGTMADPGEDGMVAWTPDGEDTVYESLGLWMTPESNRARLLMFLLLAGRVEPGIQDAISEADPLI